MNKIEIFGWLCSVVLICTIALQLRKQYKERTAIGVSKYLFTGQTLAEAGFVVYSLLIKNWVFALTSAVLLVENLIGLYLTMKFKKAEKK